MSTAATELSMLLQRHRSAILDLVGRHKGTSIAVFGSAARGEATDHSDVDFLVEFDPSSSLLDLIHLEAALHGLLGVEVEVVSTGAGSTVTKQSFAMP